MAEVDDARRAEAVARRLERSLRTLGRCNDVLFRARGEQELLQSICRILVESGGFRLAWIGYCEDDADKTVRPVATAGHDLDLARAGISWGDGEAGRGPVGTAIRTRRPCRGQACLALPLGIDEGHQDVLALHGALALHAASDEGFDETEIEPYAGLARHITHAVTQLRGNLAQDVILDVTAIRARSERRRAVEALRASEAWWREVFEHTPVVYSIVGAAGTIHSMNASGAAQLGYTSDELIGQSVLRLLFEEDRELARRHLTACLEEPGLLHSWEIRKIRKDGTALWVRENAKAVRRSGDDVIVLIASEDITERKRGEQRGAAAYAVTRVLAEADSLAAAAPQILRAIGENLEWDWGALWSSDREDAPLLCDCLWHAADVETAEFDTVSRDDAFAVGDSRVGHVWRSVLPSWIADATREPHFLRASAAARAGLHGGVIFPILLNAEALGVVEFFSRTARQRDADQLALLSAIGSQIGQFIKRRTAEAALRVNEERWRAMFETVSVGITTLDFNDGHYVTANASFQRMTGYGEDELRQLTPIDITHEDDRAETQELIAGRGVGSLQRKRYRRRDGEIVWADISTFSVPATNSRPAVFGAMVVDVTDRKHAEDALQQAQADLVRLHRLMLLGEMTASIAHEVNQPIAAVITNANAGLRWLGAQQPDVHEVRQALARIVRDGNRAGEVIKRVRALVRKVPPRRDLLDLNEAILEVTALTRPEMQRNGIGLHSRLGNEMPLLWADRVQLQQVMLNLIVNAIEAMGGAEGRHRELTIVSGTDGANVVFVEVRDTGPGLGPGTIDRLFQSFYTTKPDGIGMGLAISRSIVEAHGGWLSASPNEPRGAAFRVTLPVGETLPGSPEKSRSSPEPALRAQFGEDFPNV